MKQQKTYAILIGVVLAILGIVGVCLTHQAAITEDASAGNKMVFAISLILTVLGAVAAIAACLPHRTPDTRTQKWQQLQLYAHLLHMGYAHFRFLQQPSDLVHELYNQNQILF